LNLAQHVGDQPQSVNSNRAWLKKAVKLPSEPRWLRQVHGTKVLEADRIQAVEEADGSYSRNTGQVCVVLTADCLPILLCEQTGAAVAVVHAGWRGLAAGVVEAAVNALTPVAPGQLMAWLGPSIGPAAFVVGDEVRSGFIERNEIAAEAFRPAVGKGWHADLSQLARQRLMGCGVRHVYGGGFCTYTDHRQFFSYRRDGTTGRMATLIWIQT